MGIQWQVEEQQEPRFFVLRFLDWLAEPCNPWLKPIIFLSAVIGAPSLLYLFYIIGRVTASSTSKDFVAGSGLVDVFLTAFLGFVVVVVVLVVLGAIIAFFYALNEWSETRAHNLSIWWRQRAKR